MCQILNKRIRIEKIGKVNTSIATKYYVRTVVAGTIVIN